MQTNTRTTSTSSHGNSSNKAPISHSYLLPRNSTRNTSGPASSLYASAGRRAGRRWSEVRDLGGEVPDLFHGHYADAGQVASRLASLIDIPMAFTGHSLGRVKQQRLLDQGTSHEAIEKRYPRPGGVQTRDRPPR